MNARQVADGTVVDAINQLPGLNISSVFDLVNARYNYAIAIPVLKRLLETGVNDPLIMEGIVRAMTVPYAKGKVNEALIALFHRTPQEQSSLRWAIGNAIKVVMTPQDEQSVIEIVKDRCHGMARQEFVSSLTRCANPEIDSLLLNLLEDDDVAAHALEALRKRKSSVGVNAAKHLVAHNRQAIRNEAKKYLSIFENDDEVSLPDPLLPGPA